MKETLPYRVYSDYLMEKYQAKVYKLPVNLPLTCPNRDGKLGLGGCTFCGDVGAGFECHSSMVPIKEQLLQNRAHIQKKYKATKFIAYYQNYSNTYLPPEELRAYLWEGVQEDIVELCISTRPDCITPEHLEVMKEIQEATGVAITLELGLQTVNYHTLHRVNRGHTLGEFIDAMLLIKPYGFEVCVHLILNFPWDTMEDVIENAKVISALKVDMVKLHALYLLRNTPLGQAYLRGEFEMHSVEDYQERVITFLEYLSPSIVVQRLIGRAPEEEGIFVNWNQSWWRIRDEIHEKMIAQGRYQGSKANYLGGKALK